MRIVERECKKKKVEVSSLFSDDDTIVNVKTEVCKKQFQIILAWQRFSYAYIWKHPHSSTTDSFDPLMAEFKSFRIILVNSD